MATITLPPEVALGDTVEPETWGDVVRTALSKLPRGVVATRDNRIATTALAAGIGTSEAVTNLNSPAVATEAGRTYKLTAEFVLREGDNTTNYLSARIRRGTTTAGALVHGPTEVSKKNGTNSRDTITITTFDVPGAQAAQQWCVTLQCDASAVDVYSPSLFLVEDMGA